MTTTYETLVGEQAGDLFITWVCCSCSEEHRLVLDRDQVDAIAWLRAGEPMRRSAIMTAAAVRAASSAPDLVTAIVWQITHATSHEEQARRDACKHDANPERPPLVVVTPWKSVDHRHHLVVDRSPDGGSKVSCIAQGCPGVALADALAAQLADAGHVGRIGPEGPPGGWPHATCSTCSRRACPGAHGGTCDVAAPAPRVEIIDGDTGITVGAIDGHGPLVRTVKP